MGFDVSGVNPIIKSEQPKTPDWDTATQEEKDAYFKADSKWNLENPGYYFRNNVWWWRPLWNYVYETCGDILTNDDYNSCTYNDGHEIIEEKALMIAERLKVMLDLGHTHEYALSRGKVLDDMPDLECEYCKGTGIRKWDKKDVEIHIAAVDAIGELLSTAGVPIPEPKTKEAKCNVCSGSGKVRPWETNYPFDVENVERFMLFAGSSGGFQVY